MSLMWNNGLDCTMNRSINGVLYNQTDARAWGGCHGYGTIRLVGRAGAKQRRQPCGSSTAIAHQEATVVRGIEENAIVQKCGCAS